MSLTFFNRRRALENRKNAGVKPAVSEKKSSIIIDEIKAEEKRPASKKTDAEKLKVSKE